MDRCCGSIADKLTELMDKIPGYKGYREESARREADSVQREFMAKRLTELKRKMQDVQEECLADGNLSIMEPFDRAGNKIDRVVERIRHAVRGYSGFFSANKIGQAELDRIYEYDLSLISALNSIEEAIYGMRTAKDESMNSAVRELISTISDLDAKVDERERILKGIM